MVFLAPDSRSSTWDAVTGSFGSDVEFLDRTLQHTFARCRINPVQVALAGFSDGASYALSLGISNGDLFTHLVAYSPGFVESAERFGRPSIYVSHGAGDSVLPVTQSRDNIVPGLRRAGYEVTYLEFDGGHGVPAEISEGALDWFLGVGEQVQDNRVPTRPWRPSSRRHPLRPGQLLLGRATAPSPSISEHFLSTRASAANRSPYYRVSRQ
jgi:hypothetical protein